MMAATLVLILIVSVKSFVLEVSRPMKHPLTIEVIIRNERTCALIVKNLFSTSSPYK